MEEVTFLLESDAISGHASHTEVAHRLGQMHGFVTVDQYRPDCPIPIGADAKTFIKATYLRKQFASRKDCLMTDRFQP
jgi:hypothetical protein